MTISLLENVPLLCSVGIVSIKCHKVCVLSKEPVRWRVKTQQHKQNALKASDIVGWVTSLSVLGKPASWCSQGCYFDNKAFLHTNTFHMVTAGQQQVFKKSAHKGAQGTQRVWGVHAASELPVYQFNGIWWGKWTPSHPGAHGNLLQMSQHQTWHGLPQMIAFCPCSCAQRCLAAKKVKLLRTEQVKIMSRLISA